MDIIWQGLKEGFLLILSLDPQIMQITLLSIEVSLSALFIAAIMGIPLGAVLALKEFPGRKWLLNITYTFMGLPPVLAGLVVFLFLSASGPLGYFRLMFTPAAMVIAQVLLGFPIICGLTARAVMAQPQEVFDTAATLGATRRQAAWAIIRESRMGIIAALTTALGRLIAEVGAVTMVGGNIEGETRVLTTAIVLETRMGNDSTALGIGMVLLFIAFLIMLLILRLERKAFTDERRIQIV
ncbi:MAG: ABC transporter permease [Syntrophomonadaceae bacterium]|jgi:tungstate transport system permease protein